MGRFMGFSLGIGGRKVSADPRWDARISIDQVYASIKVPAVEHASNMLSLFDADFHPYG
jgi:hypothetical protein